MFNLVPFSFNQLERGFLSDFWGDQFFNNRLAIFKTDISDNGKEYVIEAELPGFAKEEINIEVADNQLTISAARNNETEEKKENYIRKERVSGRVSRSFAVDNVKTNEIKAEFKDGILKLVLPKKEAEENRVRRIELN
ncbi:MAG: Hsp20/alpha crystallin family protein [Bacillota bacterium]